MQYMLLIHAGEAEAHFDTLDDDERAEITREFVELARSPGVVSAHQLRPADVATTVRVQEGRALTTDGPFIAAKEAVGGVWVYEAEDIDAAIELAARIPVSRMGGAVEVRPIVERGRS